MYLNGDISSSELYKKRNSYVVSANETVINECVKRLKDDTEVQLNYAMITSMFKSETNNYLESLNDYIRMVDTYLNIGGVDTNIINTLLQNNTNAPLIYIEDNKTSYIKYRFYGLVERLKRENIKLGGAVNTNNVYIEDYIVSDNT